MSCDATLIHEIRAAINAHSVWKQRLRLTITSGQSDIGVEEIENDAGCAFGRWLFGDSIPEVAKDNYYLTVVQLHAEFHECAARVAALATSGEKESAKDLLIGEYYDRSEELVRALNQWRCKLCLSENVFKEHAEFPAYAGKTVSCGNH